VVFGRNEVSVGVAGKVGKDVFCIWRLYHLSIGYLIVQREANVVVMSLSGAGSG
jgi:hypothetical protein